MLRGNDQHIYKAMSSAIAKVKKIRLRSNGNPISVVPTISDQAKIGDVIAGPSTRVGPQSVELSPVSPARFEAGTELLSISAPLVQNISICAHTQTSREAIS